VHPVGEHASVVQMLPSSQDAHSVGFAAPASLVCVPAAQGVHTVSVVAVHAAEEHVCAPHVLHFWQLPFER
jgi:hypothetical protein